MTRRDLLRLLLASPLAAAVDVEHLLWTPRPIVTVPALPSYVTAAESDLYVLGLLRRGPFTVRMNFVDITAFGDTFTRFAPSPVRR
jgi:hypothetical protein